MGKLLSFGRILLGLLMVIAGYMIVQGGYKDHITSFKDFRNLL